MVSLAQSAARWDQIQECQSPTLCDSLFPWQPQTGKRKGCLASFRGSGRDDTLLKNIFFSHPGVFFFSLSALFHCICTAMVLHSECNVSESVMYRKSINYCPPLRLLPINCLEHLIGSYLWCLCVKQCWEIVTEIETLNNVKKDPSWATLIITAAGYLQMVKCRSCGVSFLNTVQFIT